MNIVPFQFKPSQSQDSLLARNTLLKLGDIVKIQVKRSEGGANNYQSFEVPYSQHMRVLDALNYIADHQAPDLAYRWFCGSKMCGSCAVRMNGREVLACWEAVLPEMTIDPLRNLPVIRDLVVDRTPYEKRVASYKPWLERDEPYSGFPEPLTHRDMKSVSKALDCISCMACYSACPVIGLGDLTNFEGPAPLVQLAQTMLDPRNGAKKVASTLESIDIFSCVSCYKCEEVCPSHIPIVSMIIEPLKRKVAEVHPEKARHALVFKSIIARRGWIDPTELVLRTQGFKALLNVRRVITLLLRGKVNPVKTLFGRAKVSAAAAARFITKDKS